MNTMKKPIISIAALIISLTTGVTFFLALMSQTTPLANASTGAKECTTTAMCAGDARTENRPVRREVGEDIEEVENPSGGETVTGRKPDCKLPPGRCEVTIRDEKGNVVKRFETRGLDDGGPRQSAGIKGDGRGIDGYNPNGTSPIQIGSLFAESGTEYSILQNPTRVPGGFYDPFTESDLPLLDSQPHRNADQENLQTLQKEYAEPYQPLDTGSFPRYESPPTTDSNENLTSETVRLEPGQNPEQTSEHVAIIGSNSQTTFVDPAAVTTEIATDEMTSETAGAVKSEESTFASEIASRYPSSEAGRGVFAFADDSWVDDPHTPTIHETVRGNIVRAKDDLEYLRQLDQNGVCSYQCRGEIVYRENQLRVMNALNDEMSHGYAQVISAESKSDLTQGANSVATQQYFVVLHDALGKTFLCDSNGTCSPSETFFPQAPRLNPIMLANAPVQLERSASLLQYSGGPVSYAVNELAGSGLGVFQEAIRPSPAFASRPGYPACSLLTSLIGACANWQ